MGFALSNCVRGVYFARVFCIFATPDNLYIIFIIIMHKTFLNSQLTWCVITQKWHTQTSELVTVSDWHSFSSCFCHKFTLVTVAQALEFDTDRHSEIIYDQWRQVVKPVFFLNCIVCLNKNEHIRIWLPSENYCKRYEARCRVCSWMLLVLQTNLAFTLMSAPGGQTLHRL